MTWSPVPDDLAHLPDDLPGAPPPLAAGPMAGRTRFRPLSAAGAAASVAARSCPAGPPASVASLLEELRGGLLSTSIRHHERIEARPADLRTDLSGYPPAARRVLRAAGITALYSHQAEGIEHLLAGDNVAVATPTASGKTLIYNVAVLATLLDDPAARALYLFPLKALAQDQLDELLQLRDRLCWPLAVAICDGDTPPSTRRRLRLSPPHILISTPDMLHAGLLAYHDLWAGFFAALRFVVVDELHAYSGVFGSQVLHLFRRLHRVCAHHGSSPQFCAGSATIGNPGELAARLLNRPFHAIARSGAPSAARHFVLVNPPRSPNALAAELLRACLGRGYRTICFTRARVVTELVYRWVALRDPALRARLSTYRAGYMAEERRQIERALHTGELLGVVSTSALELGIDIGGLDVCILVGYPGSIVATWQRAGRVGRGDRDSLVLLLASKDQLDQYFLRHPRQFFARGPEEAVVDPANPYILKHHLVCAAQEQPLRAVEPEYGTVAWQPAAAELAASGDLLRSADDQLWFAARRRPHRLVSLRSIGEPWTIVAASGTGPIGTVGGHQVHSECHAGAVYLHRGRQYVVQRQDPATRRILAAAADVPYFTRPRRDRQTEILEELRARPTGAGTARLGRLRVRTQVVGFEEVRIADQAVLGQHALECPVEEFETVGYWIELDARAGAQLVQAGRHFLGSIHAAEHAMKSLFPLLVLCDRTDVGGISFAGHPQLRSGGVFVYDYRPGGIGLAERGFERLDELLALALEMVAACGCAAGCPACIHFPTCGHGNVPLDKAGCVLLLELLTGRRPLAPPPAAGSRARPATGAAAPPAARACPPQADPRPRGENPEEPARRRAAEVHRAQAAPSASRLTGDELTSLLAASRVVVFDLETQRSAAEVGGWERADRMGVSAAVAWDSRQQSFATYWERDVDRLLDHLRAADLVVGFNVLEFDYRVLRGYAEFDCRAWRTLDILREVHERLRCRVSLDSLARATLGTAKSANGLQALRWWKEGRLDLIEQYCRQDVAVTRDLFCFGLEHGHLVVDRRGQGPVRLPVAWELEALTGPTGSTAKATPSLPIDRRSHP